MRLRTAILVAAVLAAVTPGAHALLYVSVLSGGAEVPPVTTTGTGTANLDFDIPTNTMKVDITFSGLVSDSTVAHIHCCTAPAAGVATAVPTFPGFPAGVRSGSYSQSFDMLAASTWNPAFITANGGTPASAAAALQAGLDAGTAYFNVHSVMFGAGEIRGNLTPIPEPSSVALMALGLGAVAWGVRRRRKD